MKDVMLDFETFGNGPDAVVCQIGACYFDRTTGEIGETFKVNVNARTSKGELDADTVYWWLSQSDEARKSLTGGMTLEILAFANLNRFLEKSKAIWSHATFDFVLLTETLKRLGIEPAFGYRAARDIRTLIDLADVDTRDFQREGVAHDALEDCKFQVKYCVAAMKKLIGVIP